MAVVTSLAIAHQFDMEMLPSVPGGNINGYLIREPFRVPMAARDNPHIAM